MKLDMFCKSVPIGSMGLLFFTYTNGGFLQMVNVGKILAYMDPMNYCSSVMEFFGPVTILGQVTEHVT